MSLSFTLFKDKQEWSCDTFTVFKDKQEWSCDTFTVFKESKNGHVIHLQYSKISKSFYSKFLKKGINKYIN